MFTFKNIKNFKTFKTYLKNNKNVFTKTPHLTSPCDFHKAENDFSSEESCIYVDIPCLLTFQIQLFIWFHFNFAFRVW